MTGKALALAFALAFTAGAAIAQDKIAPPSTTGAATPPEVRAPQRDSEYAPEIRPGSPSLPKQPGNNPQGSNNTMDDGGMMSDSTPESEAAKDRK